MRDPLPAPLARGQGWLSGALLLGLLPQAPAAGSQDPPPIPAPPEGAVDAVASGQWTPARDLSVYFEGALVDTRNGDDFVETPGYRKLLEEVRSWPEPDFNGRPLVRLDHEAAMADPDAWRGKLVTVQGILTHLWAERLSRPIWDQVDAYRAIVTETDASEGVICDLLGTPPDLELPDGVRLRRDLVDVDGVFYRTVRYENTAGETREAPYLIAKRIRIADLSGAARSSRQEVAGIALIGAALVFMVFRGAVALRKRRNRARSRPGAPGSFRNLFEERLRSTPPSRRGPPRT